MIMYDVSSHLPEKVKHTFRIVVSIGLVTALLYALSQFMKLGMKHSSNECLFGYIPAYLAIFYSASVLICVIVLYLKGYSYYNSLIFGFLISYISSFYWELPENIFWQLKRGYHPAIIFVLLGVFPYIWLDKKLGWKKTYKNIFLVLLGWAATTYGVLTMESNIYTTYTGTIYFLFCRVVCLIILINIFTQRRNIR